jgi:putative holliday junction resolvase
VSEPISTGRLIGLDYGTVRIGLAITDPDRILASPLVTYTRKSEAEDAAYLAKIIADNQIVSLVVGLPIHSDGRESEKSREARSFGNWLARETNLPVVYWDERFSTARAEDALIGANLKPSERKVRRDKVAAQIILQAYLDAGCPSSGTLTPPETWEEPPEDDPPR